MKTFKKSLKSEDEFFPRPSLSYSSLKEQTYEKEKVYSLDEKLTISCVEGYGETITNPSIETPSFRDGKVSFSFSPSKTVTLDLSTKGDIEVLFED